MPREFNTAGPCISSDHYMIPAERRLLPVRHLIDNKKYFVIHAPRQTGKTTLLKALAKDLNDKSHYMAVVFSFESFTNPDPVVSMPQIITSLEQRIKQQVASKAIPPSTDNYQQNPHIDFMSYLARWAKDSAQPIVLFLDRGSR